MEGGPPHFHVVMLPGRTRAQSLRGALHRLRRLRPVPSVNLISPFCRVKSVAGSDSSRSRRENWGDRRRCCVTPRHPRLGRLLAPCQDSIHYSYERRGRQSGF